MTTTVRMIIGDVRDVMAAHDPDGDAFDLLVTSPPFLALRSYLPADHPDKHREIGSEPTPATFLDTLYGLTADWGRLLPEWASICVELGDTMSGSGGAGGDYNAGRATDGQPRFSKTGRTRRATARSRAGSARRRTWPRLAARQVDVPHPAPVHLGLAYGTQPAHRHAPPPPDSGGSATWSHGHAPTRPSAPSANATRTNGPGTTSSGPPAPTSPSPAGAPADTSTSTRCGRNTPTPGRRCHRPGRPSRGTGSRHATVSRMDASNPAGAPPLDWHTDQLDGDWLWKLATAPYPGAHYATYPLTLPRRLILAMCPAEVCRCEGGRGSGSLQRRRWPARTGTDPPTTGGHPPVPVQHLAQTPPDS